MRNARRVTLRCGSWRSVMGSSCVRLFCRWPGRGYPRHAPATHGASPGAPRCIVLACSIVPDSACAGKVWRPMTTRPLRTLVYLVFSAGVAIPVWRPADRRRTGPGDEHRRPACGVDERAGPPAHDGCVEDHRVPAQSRRLSRGDIRREDRQSISEAAGSPHVRQRHARSRPPRSGRGAAPRSRNCSIARCTAAGPPTSRR